MHIPKGETSEQEILTFREAMEERRPDREYDPGRWLYVPDHYSEYRYILGTRGERPLIAVGINPSTAAPDDLDNTLKSVERIALGNGYDSFLMMNVYAQRATDPDAMDRLFNPLLHEENMKTFRYCLSLAGRGPRVWAAWGSISEKRTYLTDCIADMTEAAAEAGAVWLRAGPLSRMGHPHHPLYLKKDTILEPFDADGYIWERKKKEGEKARK